MMRVCIKYMGHDAELASAQAMRDALMNRRAVLEQFGEAESCGGGINIPIITTGGDYIGREAGRAARADGAPPVYFTNTANVPLGELFIAIIFDGDVTRPKHAGMGAMEYWERYEFALAEREAGKISAEWVELAYAQLVFAAWLEGQGRRVDLAALTRPSDWAIFLFDETDEAGEDYEYGEEW